MSTSSTISLPNHQATVWTEKEEAIHVETIVINFDSSEKSEVDIEEDPGEAFKDKLSILYLKKFEKLT